ncbi:GumC family protein [Ruegeria arenilitoris]|uniref:GumC family protein n=1 Tax=Ruegeria arenilitoris TaxID=1173585 RepID=UPI00148032DE
MQSGDDAIASQHETNDFINIWLLLRRNLLVIFLLVVGAVSATAFYMSTIPDQYRSDAQMVLALTETRFSESTGQLETYELNRSSVETELARLRSRDFAEQVADRLGLFDDPSFVRRAPGADSEADEEIHRAAVTDKVLASYSVSRAGESLAISIEGRSTSPVLAAALPNTVIAVYIANERDARVNRLMTSIDNLKRRVGILGEELTQAESNLAEFIREDNLDDEQFVTRLRAEVERRKAQLRIGIERNLPEDEILALQEQLITSEQELEARTRLELSLLRREREVELLRTRYQTTIDNLTLLETRIGQLEDGTVQVSKARIPVEPYAPSRSLITVLAGLFAMIVGFIIALVREGLDRTVRSENQIFRMTGLSNLGYIARQRRSKMFAGENKAIENLLQSQKSPLAEAARGILTNCIKFQHSKVILITSGLPNEGKSFVSSVLATSAAVDGLNALLIDLDTHRRGATKTFIPDMDEVQLSEIYSDSVTLQHALTTETKGSLDLITAASPTHELSDAASNKLKQLKETLLDQYDIIIVDTPPALVMDEVYRNDILADAVLLVARWGKTPQHALQAAAKRLQSSGFNVLGTILNDVDPKKYRWTTYEGYYGTYDDY